MRGPSFSTYENKSKPTSSNFQSFESESSAREQSCVLRGRLSRKIQLPFLMMSQENALGSAHIRLVRPTDDIPALLTFYRDGLGFKVLGEFNDHEGFDGVMLGLEGASYHLEFTRKHHHEVGRAPTQDNLLVFYVPDKDAFARTVEHMKDCGFLSVASYNPYWDRCGRTFEDPDGYRVVLANTANPMEK